MCDFFLKTNFDIQGPIYKQIMDTIKIKIATEEYPLGSKILSVRDFAELFGVNPNTVQKALSKLEDANLLYSEGTSGRFVTTDKDILASLKKELPKKIIKNFIVEMSELGICHSKLSELIENYREEKL